MKNVRFNAAAAALALLGLCTLAAPDARAVSVPLVNGDFSNGFNGWTENYANVPDDGNAFGLTFADTTPVDNTKGIFNYAFLQCVIDCPGNLSSSLSQTVNTLVTGHQYQLSLYAMGLTNPGENASPLPAGPLTITLGNQSSGPITVPLYTGDPSPTTWQREAFNFTYTGSGSSATLSLFQNFAGINLGCAPCAETMWLANVALDDVTPVIPGPQVAEPSSLLSASLGLGLLGLYFRRQYGKGVGSVNLSYQ